MDGPVRDIVNLSIVLIAVAVLIGIGFGIFQNSKDSANSGVNDVQKELAGVMQSKVSSYDQKIVTGNTLASGLKSFSGESLAVLIATQTWIDAAAKTSMTSGVPDGGFDSSKLVPLTSGLKEGYDLTGTPSLPLIGAYTDDTFATLRPWTTTKNEKAPAVFINYNAMIGTKNVAGDTGLTCTVGGQKITCGKIYFDTDCYRVTTNFATDASGKILYNNVTGATSKTGNTEFIPSSAKFETYLIKDKSDTTVGICAKQLAK